MKLDGSSTVQSQHFTARRRALIEWQAVTDPATRAHTRLRRYTVTLIALLLAAALTLLTVRLNLPRQIIGYAFLLVIMGSAWWGGYGPGLLTAVTTLLLAPYLLQPTYSIRHPNFTNAPQVFLISVLISRMAAAREKLRDANELLDQRVRVRTAELETANRALRERESQLIAHAESLSQSNADLEQFAYFASHDLQEPLRMIAVYTELLEHNHKSHFDEESAMCARTVRDSVGRLELLVRDLLLYSRAIHGEQVEAAEIDPGDALQIVIANLKPQIEDAGAEIIVHSLPRLNANPVHLVQILQNLIGNALKYRGAQPPRIVVAASRTQSECVFSVKDNGIGISPDYSERIFVPFKRLHGQQYPGSGVGLAICRRIVDRFGGRIWVESELGHGATFYFSVPSAAAQQEPARRTSLAV